MIRFNIQNFKCFYDASIKLNGLTVLTGANGFGKSSIIQALLFLRQTIEHCAKWDGNTYIEELDTNLNVELNGPYCLSLGMSKNIIPVESSIHSSLTLDFSNDSSTFKSIYDLDDEKNYLWLKLKEYQSHNDSRNLPIFLQQFYYLNAERIGPRIAQKIKFHDYPNVGWQGEYTAQILADYGYLNDSNTKFEVEKEKLFDIDDKNRYLLKQTQDWLNFLMPDVKIQAIKNDSLHTAQIIIQNYYTKGAEIIATNIGFGISYVLPIIVTGLIAQKGSIMIVENPEAHLHPSAQSKIGHFLAKMADAGVIVLVETHSDHVINGIQIAAARELIDHNLININFFGKNIDTAQPKITEITVNKYGELSCWPRGFFDQTQIDYSTLFKLKLDD